MRVRSGIGFPLGERPAPVQPQKDSYYGIPFLKPPTWDWKIAAYFFLEAVSSGSFLMAALSDLAGRDRFPSIRRAGYLLSAAAFAPCPPLLIADLGRPERFHHMLRIFKPTSPMSHGSWALAAYGVPMSILAGEQIVRDLPLLPASFRKKAGHLIPIHELGTLGIPCALMLATYPGVLLSTTSNPLWSRSRLLGALFAASSLHAGAAAVSTALARRDAHTDEAARVARILRLASFAETGLLAAWIAAIGPSARTLMFGKQRRAFWFGAMGLGIVAPLLLKLIAPRKSGLARFVRGALSLAGAFALKWAIVHAGRDAAAESGRG